MASDARSLLRAAAQQRKADGIQDRYASYHPTTQALRCAACAFLPIKHDSLWSSHASSKSHRNNVARLNSEEQRRAAAAPRSAAGPSSKKGKRKQDDDDETTLYTKANESASSEQLASPARASQIPNGAGGPEAKRARIALGEAGSATSSSQQGIAAQSVDEDEWARFEQEVLEADHHAGSAATGNDFDIHAAAALSAEPVLHGQAGDGDGDDVMQEDDGNAPAALSEAQLEEERRLQREREEKEEILMRFEEEQRLQDEADERVNALKNRIQAFKAARQAKQSGQNDSAAAADDPSRSSGKLTQPMTGGAKDRPDVSSLRKAFKKKKKQPQPGT
ncbi:hypothetical protein V8E36_004809 [Tilletia maclaganii]